MKIQELLHESWLNVININAKWVFSIIFRGVFLGIIIVGCLAFLQFIGYIPKFPGSTDTIIIENAGSKNLSKPGVNYQPVIDDLQSTIQMLKDRRKQIDKLEETEKL